MGIPVIGQSLGVIHLSVAEFVGVARLMAVVVVDVAVVVVVAVVM